MSELELGEWIDPNNIDILNAIRNNASLEYQHRIPNADKANIDETIHNLISWVPSMNEFLYSLVNVIGMQIYRNVNAFTNPLAKYKRGMLMTGDTIEEIMNGLLEAHRYEANDEYLEKAIFGTERPETQVNFHKINRKDWYKLSIKQVELRKAFTTENGLNQFITNLMSTPQTSDQLDEFLVTASLFAEWYKYEGFFKVNVPDVSAQGSDQADSQALLRRLKEMAATLPFVSRLYNPAHLPMSVAKDELELIVTPEADAAMDVEALAGAFNIEKAEFTSRKTVIPAQYIGIPGFQAMLTTRDFFVIADSLYETQTANNPVGLNVNYILHHQQVISASRFAPAVLYTSTDESTPIIINDTPVVSVDIPTLLDAGGDGATDVIRGMNYQVVCDAVTNPTGGENDAVKFLLAPGHSQRTVIWQNGLLAVAIDEKATTITINVVSVDNREIRSTATFDVVGDRAQLWPDPHVDVDSDDDGLFELDLPDELTLDGDGNVIIPVVEGGSWTKTVNTGIAFTVAGNKVTIPSHDLSLGDQVVFGAITATTNFTAATDYFVKSIVDDNNVTLSASVGGAVVVVNAAGTAVSATVTAHEGAVLNVPDTTTVELNAVPEDGWELPSGNTGIYTLVN